MFRAGHTRMMEDTMADLSDVRWIVRSSDVGASFCVDEKVRMIGIGSLKGDPVAVADAINRIRLSAQNTYGIDIGYPE